jgi:transaldolase
MNTSQQLHQAGQSIWYDNIQRGLLDNGALAGMIERGEIRGVTSNPTIFMNAIVKSTDYDAGLESLAKAGFQADQIFWNLAIQDIQRAADLFRPLYEQSRKGDGYVSLEVNPFLAHDTQGTLAAVRWIWAQVDRPNLMVKIPATLAGLPAIRAAIAAGINVNVTLIFSRQRYAAVMDAYLEGLEQRAAGGLPVDSIASVASFFVSRVDTKVDPRLQAIRDQALEPGALAGDAAAQAAKAASLQGKLAIANARAAYADYKAVFGSPRFQALKALGAGVQRPLWASTGTKNPAYSDVLYVEELIGRDTVNTVPPATLAALLDHGVVRANSLEENLAEAHQALADLESLGIPVNTVTDELEAEGVKAFADAFTDLLNAVESRRQAVLSSAARTPPISPEPRTSQR